MTRYLCAVDVGTLSARAGIFEAGGDMLSRAVVPFGAVTPAPGRLEHASADIWRATCAAVAEAREAAGAAPDDVGAIAFGATCSLVLRDSNGAPLGLSGPERDVLSWSDHRAVAEAEACTATRHTALDFLGGAMSPEMQLPKLMWLKRRRPEHWAALGAAYDLCDFLASRASGAPVRSASALATKWCCDAATGGWRHDFLAAIGLEDLIGRSGLPAAAAGVGSPAGRLTASAAAELGLGRSCVVSVGMVDAYAGALGALGGVDRAALDRDLALVAGTSACVMRLAPEPCRIAGLWGPFHGAVLPGLWASEGGLSAAGSLLDHVLESYLGPGAATSETHDRVARRIAVLIAEEGGGLGAGLHILPDFHGVRTSLGGPAAGGVVSGLTLDRSFDTLCRVYWRTAVAVALGLRQVVEHFRAHEAAVERLHMAGGHARSPLLPQLFADATGCALRIEPDRDLVLLGAAAAAATAAGRYDGLAAAAVAMARPGRSLTPDPTRAAVFDRDYAVFLRMQAHRREIASMTA